jgi:hypothetical protein
VYAEHVVDYLSHANNKVIALVDVQSVLVHLGQSAVERYGRHAVDFILEYVAYVVCVEQRCVVVFYVAIFCKKKIEV